jgi:hypothetical protein
MMGEGTKEVLLLALPVGIGATIVMDLFGIFRGRVLKQPAADYGLVGRWLGHMPRGIFVHRPIGKSPPVAGERIIGWAAHYLTGIAFAAILLALFGAQWARHPTLLPAAMVGVGSLAAPFLLMQPGMGQGIAARLTPKPWPARARSLITHLSFGLGLYAAGRLTAALTAQ